MKDIVFKKIHTYTSNLSLKEIELKLQFLLSKDNESSDRFEGKVKLPLFSLTPKLGPRRQFKPTMNGEILEGKIIKITYRPSYFLKLLAYGMPVLYTTVGVFLYFIGIDINIGLFNHVEFYPGIIAILTFAIFKMVFDTLYEYYSKLLINYLDLELIN